MRKVLIIIIFIFLQFLFIPSQSYTQFQFLNKNISEDTTKIGKNELELDSKINPKFKYYLGIFGDGILTGGKNKNGIKDENAVEDENSFELGEITLYSTFNFHDRFNAMFEIAFENEEEHQLDIENLWLGYLFNDELAINVNIETKIVVKTV